MTAVHTDHPARRAGKSKLHVTHTWGCVAAHAEVMHLFWGLSGQAGGKSMCGLVSTTGAPAPGFAVQVCQRCRDIGLPGHPLPRGMM